MHDRKRLTESTEGIGSETRTVAYIKPNRDQYKEQSAIRSRAGLLKYVDSVSPACKTHAVPCPARTPSSQTSYLP